MITDSGAANSPIPVVPDPLNPNPKNLSTKGKAKATSKPANEVITDSTVVTGREAIDLGLAGAHMPKARLASNQRGGPDEADTAAHVPTAVASRSGRSTHRHAL
jgi:hypothetical protein